jgi:predicted CxxxxCH...CXXCH cytochrome family protein
MRAICGIVALVLAGCVGELDGPVQENPPPNTEPLLGCAGTCHGSETTNAPPKGITGQTDTTEVGVGAHMSHLDPSPTWHRKVECADCHVVPDSSSSPGHIDGDNKAEVTFSTLAGATASMWNGTTCAVKCHGQTSWGGTKVNPTWTQVDGTQSACGSCHGAPPPAPHPTVTGNNCAECHPTMEENSLTFRDPDSHINGVVDLTDAAQTGGCTTCHGSTNSAPPKDLAGGTARTSAGVGAHQEHLGTGTFGHRAVVCSDCHVVPTALNSIGAYAVATTTCSSNYCHGNGRGGNGTISWLTTGPLQCGACHSINGTNMSGRHSRHINGENMKCSQCHATVVNANMQIITANLHVNGVHEVKMANGTWNAGARTCSNTGCHGTKGW